jgi:2-amino-4-hydroxy-6-hydroxymethyldihydropteridine diphosphokinase
MAIKVYLSLGSNLGDRTKNLEQAVLEIARVHGVTLSRTSRVYEAEPMGDKGGHHLFLNQVVEIETDVGPLELFHTFQALEKKLGREAHHHGAARPIDIDILMYGDEVIDLPELTVPHPGLMERRFVLEPLLELLPEARFAEALKKLPESPKVTAL